MDCLPVSKLSEGSQWLWKIKLDGYRAVAVKSGHKFAYMVQACAMKDGMNPQRFSYAEV